MDLKLVSLCGAALAEYISDSTTTVKLKSPSVPFPSLNPGEYFYLSAQSALGDYELMKVTSVVAGVAGQFILTVERGHEGTISSPFNVDDQFNLSISAGFLSSLLSEDTQVADLDQLSVTNLYLKRQSSTQTHYNIVFKDKSTGKLTTLSLPTVDGKDILFDGKKLESDSVLPDQYPVGSIVMYKGTLSKWGSNSKWKICDGDNGAVNLSGKFVIAGLTSEDKSTPTNYQSGTVGGHTHADDYGANPKTVITSGTELLPEHIPPHKHIFNPYSSEGDNTAPWKMGWISTKPEDNPDPTDHKTYGWFGGFNYLFQGALGLPVPPDSRTVIMHGAGNSQQKFKQYFTPVDLVTISYPLDWNAVTTHLPGTGRPGHTHSYTVDWPKHALENKGEHSHRLEIYPDYYEVIYMQKVLP